MKPLLLWLLFGIVLTLSFEWIYKNELSDLKKEVKEETQASKVAYKISFTYFDKKEPLWLFKGEKINSTSENRIVIEHFEAQNLKKYLKAVADRAIYLRDKNRLILEGDVNILTKKKARWVRIKTEKAYVDLSRKIVYTPPTYKVVIEEPYRTLIGNGFQYDLKTGQLIILKDVQTFINGS